MGKCTSLGLLEFFFFYKHLNCLRPVSCFSPSWIPCRAYHRGGWSGWWLDAEQHTLFTEMAGNVFFFFFVHSILQITNLSFSSLKNFLNVKIYHDSNAFSCRSHAWGWVGAELSGLSCSDLHKGTKWVSKNPMLRVCIADFRVFWLRKYVMTPSLLWIW